MSPKGIESLDVCMKRAIKRAFESRNVYWMDCVGVWDHFVCV